MLKGVAILLVVYAHTQRGLSSRAMLPEGGVWGFVDAWIYAFHMPAFFFISGLFAYRSASRPAGSYLLTKARTIVWPYVVWSVLQFGMMIAGGVGSWSDRGFADLWTIVYRPEMQFWFLYVLVMMQVVLLGSVKGGLPRAGVAGVFVALSLVPLVGLMDYMVVLNQWGPFILLCMHALAFGLGVACEPWLTPGLKRLPAWGLGLMGLAAFAAMTALLLTPWGQGPWVFRATAVLGSGGLVAWSAALSRLPSACMGWLVVLGRASLEIYVAHIIVTALFRTAFVKLGLNDPVLNLVVGTAVGVLVPLGLYGLSRRFAAVTWLFRWPGGVGRG